MQVFPSKPHHILLFILTQKYCPNQLVRLFLVSTEKSLIFPDREQALNSSSIFPYIKLFMLCLSTFLAAILYHLFEEPGFTPRVYCWQFK